MKKTVLINSDMDNETVKIIESLGCITIRLPKNPCIAEPVSSHPDMSVCRIGNKLICSECYFNTARDILTYLSEQCNIEIIISSKKQSAAYPSDIAYNAFVSKSTLIAKMDCISDEIKKEAAEIGLVSADVKQGYSACSTLSVSDSAVITADKNIASAASEIGMEALLISPGNIYLKGYDYGFIGGASCRIENKIIFFGDISNHPDWKNIRDFTEKNGCKILHSSHILTDYGGCIVIQAN